MEKVSCKEFMALCMEGPWSNGACLGYVYRALRELKYPDDEIQRVLAAVNEQFDFVSVDDAARVYMECPW